MEPVCSLGPDRQDATKLCIICNEECERTCGEQGKTTLQAAAQARTKLRDLKYRSALSRINHALVDSSVQIFCHTSCYASFTSKAHINRLDTKTEESPVEPSTSQTEVPRKKQQMPSAMLRSSVASIDWNMCMFCQVTTRKEHLTNVTSFNRSNTILEASKYDPVLHVRLSGVHDLIAAEGKYHNNCCQKFLKRTTKTKQSVCVENTGVALEWLATELRETAKKAQVLELSEVWSRYCELWLQLQMKMCLSPLSAEKVHSKTKSSQKSVMCMTS